MASYLPAVILSLFAGVAADRSNRKTIMLSADFARTIFVLLIPLAFYFQILNPTLLGVNAFCIAIAAAFFNPARDSIIPQIVESDGLMRANSLMQTSWQFSLLLGPAVAGGLLTLVGNVHLFTADSAFYAVSFIFVLLIKPKARKMNNRFSGIGFREIKDGLKYVVQHPVILPLLIITMLDNIFIMGPAIVGTPVFVREELHLGASAYAMIQFSYAFGMLISTALLIKYGDRFKSGKILLTGMILDGITFIPLFFVKSLHGTMITIVIHSLAIPLLTVPRASIIQKMVPDEYTGRVFALVNMAVVGMSAISAGLTGFALEIFGARWVYFLIGLAGGFCGVVGWLFAKALRETD